LLHPHQFHYDFYFVVWVRNLGDDGAVFHCCTAGIEPETAVVEDVLNNTAFLCAYGEDALEGNLMHVIAHQYGVSQENEPSGCDYGKHHEFRKRAVKEPMVHRDHEKKTNEEACDCKPWGSIACKFCKDVDNESEDHQDDVDRYGRDILNPMCGECCYKPFRFIRCVHISQKIK